MVCGMKESLWVPMATGMHGWLRAGSFTVVPPLAPGCPALPADVFSRLASLHDAI